MKSLGCACLLTLLLVAPITSSQEIARTVMLKMNSDTGGAVGRQLAYELREQLAKASSLRPSQTRDAMVVAHVIFVDHEKDSASQNLTTTYSLVLTTPHHGGNHYLGQFVGVCGMKKVEQCAKEMLAEVSEVELWTPAQMLPSQPKLPVKK